MNSKINTIIFDLGGVLVDWDPKNMYKKVFKTTEEMDWFLDNVCTFEWNMEQDGGRLIADAVDLKVKEFPEFEEQIRMFYDRWEEMFIGIFQKNIDVQQKLIANPNYSVYALTNWSGEKWERSLELFPFFNDFEGVIVSGKVKMRKPNDDIFQLILNRFNINPKTTVFIDDNLENTIASERNGLQTIHLKSTSNLKSELTNFGVEI